MISKQARIAFFPIPKVASTTLRHTFYELAHGKPFQRDANEKPGSIFDIKRLKFRENKDITPDDLPGYFTFAIIRDPLTRLRSAYSFIFPKKFIRASKGETLPKEYADLNPRPSFEQFVLDIDAYVAASSNLAFHLSPYQQWLGTDLTKFSKIYRLEEIGEIEADLQKRVGKHVKVGFKNRGSAPPVLPSLSEPALEAALQFCAADYELCADFYPCPGKANQAGLVAQMA